MPRASHKGASGGREASERTHILWPQLCLTPVDQQNPHIREGDITDSHVHIGLNLCAQSIQRRSIRSQQRCHRQGVQKGRQGGHGVSVGVRRMLHYWTGAAAQWDWVSCHYLLVPTTCCWAFCVTSSVEPLSCFSKQGVHSRDRRQDIQTDKGHGQCEAIPEDSARWGFPGGAASLASMHESWASFHSVPAATIHKSITVQRWLLNCTPLVRFSNRSGRGRSQCHRAVLRHRQDHVLHLRAHIPYQRRWRAENGTCGT